MDNPEKRIKINGVKNGLLLGLVFSAVGIFYFYYVTEIAHYITEIAGPALLLIAGRVVFPLLIPILTLVFFCFNTRKKIGGLWTFKQATTGIFIMLITAYVVYSVGVSLIFDKLIEPNNIQKTEIAIMTAKVYIMKQNGANQKKIDAAIADTKKDFVQSKYTSAWFIVFENAIAILFLFLFALIFGSLFKNAEYISATKIKQ